MISKQLQRIDDVFQSEIDNGTLQAAEIVIARRNKVVFHQKFGGDKDKKSTSSFELGSLNQPVIAVAALMLLEQGKFQLLDPVEKYLPEFTNILVYAQDGSGKLLKQNQPFTVQMLFTHSAGFSGGNDNRSIVVQQYHKAGLFQKRNLEQMVSTLSEIPLQSQPGQRWQPGLSIDILARLVEMYSNQGVHQYVTQQIFTPLKMTNSQITGYNDQLTITASDITSENDQPVESVAKDNSAENGGAKESVAKENSAQYPPSSFTDTIRFQSSVEDYLRFAAFLLNGGQLEKTRLLGNKTVELMTTPQLDKTQVEGLPAGVNMGLGLFLVEDPAANMSYGNPGSYYWINDSGSMLWVDPKEQLIVVLALQQQGPATDLNKKITAVVYGAIKE